MLSLTKIFILAVIQGLCELLPVSSSAHVVIAEKLMGLNPSKPEMTLLLVMLHTGTMFAVIAYFWRGWHKDYFSSMTAALDFAKGVIVATVMTVVVAGPIILFIEKVIMRGQDKAEIEMLFSNLPLVAGALAAAGLLIVYAGSMEERNSRDNKEIHIPAAFWIGAVQGLCLPFRGFSRSGSTISTGLILGLPKRKLEEFSFALAVVITPPVILREIHRLMKEHAFSGASSVLHLFAPSLIGMALSFLAGLLALKWLSRWLERGQWKLFGFYCIAAAIGVLTLHCAWGY